MNVFGADRASELDVIIALVQQTTFLDSDRLQRVVRADLDIGLGYIQPHLEIEAAGKAAIAAVDEIGAVIERTGTFAVARHKAEFDAAKERALAAFDTLKQVIREHGTPNFRAAALGMN